MDRRYILSRHEELRGLRVQEEPAWRDIAEMLSPEDNQFTGPKTKADYGAIYDSTPLYAHDDFVSGLFGQATNPANRWFLLGDADPEMSAYKPVKDWLWAVSNIIGYSFQPAVSPFYAEVPAWFADIGAFGNGALYTQEFNDGRILDKSIPLRELYLERDVLGDLDTVHRAYRMSRRQAARVFGESPGLSGMQGGEVTIIHAVFRNDDWKPEKLDSHRFHSVYCSPDVQGLWRVSGYREMPYHIPAWQRGIGPHWGRGPGHRVRADMRTLNEMERVHLVAANFAAEPPLLVHQDSDLTAADIEPNALLHGGISEQGKELARVLNRSQNLQLSMQQSEQRRKAIRDGFYFSMMQVVNRPQMTATEVLGYKEENLRLMGPNLARIQHGGLSPLIARRFAMLERMRVLPPPPRELEGRALSVQYISPLALAQKASEGRAVMQLVGATAQIAQFRLEVQRHRAQAQQRQTQLADAAQQVEIAATASHAAQAATLSGGRRAA